MKAKLLVTLAGAGLILMLTLALTAGAAVQADSRPNHAPPLDSGGAVLGDYYWSPLGGPIAPGGQVLGLAVHPSIPGMVYAAVSSAGANETGPSTIYMSTDSAASWAPVFQAENQVNCLAANGPNVFAGAFQHSAGEGPAIYASYDGGTTWHTPLSLDNRGVMIDLSVDPGNADLAIIGGLHNDQQGWESGMVYGTQDGGVTWNLLLQVSVPDQNAVVMAVLISPHDPDLMLAALRGNGQDDTRVYRSTNGGASWADVFTLTGVHFSDLMAHPGDPDVLYAGAGNGPHSWGPSQVYRSGDAGLTWDLVLPEAGGPLAFEPPTTVYTVSGGQAWASSANGDPGTWSQVGNLWDGAVRLGIDLGSSPATLYAGLNSSGVALSANGGVDWQDASSGITSLAVPRDIDVDPVNLDKLFVATEAGKGGWRSDDGGASWTQVMGGPLQTFEIQPGDPDVVYAGMSACDSATVWRSEDGGLTFTGVYTPIWFQPGCSGGNEDILAVEVAPSDPQWVYAVGEAQQAGQDWQGVVVRSQDGGLTWSQVFTAPMNSALNTLAVSALDDQVAWVGGYDRSAGPQDGVIYRTQDGGGTWQQVFVDDNNAVRSIVVDPADPTVVYAACDQSYNVYKSTDGGDTWNLIRSNGPPFNAPSGNKLAIDPLDHNRIYLGGWGYIAESPDGGATWSEWDAPINQGTPQTEPRSLAADAGSPVQTLYAGFSGVWAHTRPAPVSGDRYVATTGDDTMNSCTVPPNPCRTVSYAVSVANPGETIRVAAGTYLENVEITHDLSVLGGYSGVPDWVRDPALYVTVLDGSDNPAIPGDWDGNRVRYSMVITDGGTYKMWYTGCDMADTCRIGYATSDDGITWTKDPANPVLDLGDGGSWDGNSLEAPFVIKEGPNSYKMWYNGYSGCAIGYATSPDGVSWTKHAGNPVLAPGADNWNNVCVAGQPTVLYEGGLYKMWLEAAGDDGSGQQVYMAYATSPDGIIWTWDAGNPLFGRDWEEWFWRPFVLAAGGGYQMWYSVWAGGAFTSYATSPDGIAWTKHGSPVLSGTPGEWDDGFAADPAVVYDGSQYRLWYDNSNALGLAESSDGVDWTKHPGNPVLGPGYLGEQGAPVVSVHTPWQGVLGQIPGSVARCIAPPEQDPIQVVLDGLTVTGGTYWDGAGVRVENAQATLQGVRVIGNQALGNGGGIGVYNGSTVQILASEILSNTAQNWGGGAEVSNVSHVSMEKVEVRGNHAVTGEGGGLLFQGDGTEGHLTDVQVVENQADGGGGISLTKGPNVLLVLDRVEIARNVARWAAGLRPYQSTVIGDRVWIADNVATEEGCGGFNADGSDVSLTNAWIVGNAGNAGCSNAGTLTLTNVTVADNTHSSGTGGLSVSGNGIGTVRNSILFYNGNDDLTCDAGTTCTVEYSDLEHPWAGAGNISADPSFVDQAGGDYHLLHISPCIDQASLAYAPDHDIDGEPRPFDGDGDGLALPDVGADEWPGYHIFLPLVLRSFGP